jgi:hypothetical protein
MAGYTTEKQPAYFVGEIEHSLPKVYLDPDLFRQVHGLFARLNEATTRALIAHRPQWHQLRDRQTLVNYVTDLETSGNITLAGSHRRNPAGAQPEPERRTRDSPSHSDSKARGGWNRGRDYGGRRGFPHRQREGSQTQFEGFAQKTVEKATATVEKESTQQSKSWNRGGPRNQGRPRSQDRSQNHRSSANPEQGKE